VAGSNFQAPSYISSKKMGLAALNEPWGGKFQVPAVIVILCSTLSLYNALELLLLILVTFKKRCGLYFWSLLVSSLGVILYSGGYIFDYFHLTYTLVGDIINNIGWWTMVTGQSVVLYSRLHLVLHDPKVLRFVLYMIVVDAIIFHGMTTIVHFGTYSSHQGFNKAFKVVEKFQMTGFCIQEFIISGLYTKEVVRYLHIVTQKGVRRTMWELFTINVFIVALDIGLLVIEYLNLSVFEITFKGVVYSVKLKMELAILGKLVSMSQSGNRVVSGDKDVPATFAHHTAPTMLDERGGFSYRERRRPSSKVDASNIK
jgi:hypothetical protein